MPYQTWCLKTCKQRHVSNEIIIIASFYMQMKHQSEKNIDQQVQNIGLQQMFKVLASGPNTRPQPSTPLVSHIVSDRLLHVCSAVSEVSQLLQEII